MGCWITLPHASRGQSSGEPDLVQVHRGTYKQTLPRLRPLLRVWKYLISRAFRTIQAAFEEARTTLALLLSSICLDSLADVFSIGRVAFAERDHSLQNLLHRSPVLVIRHG